MLGRVLCRLYTAIRWKDVLALRRATNGFPGMVLRPVELFFVVDTVKKFRDCRLLVFGVGNDSPYWNSMNVHGKTIFLEDSPEWIQNIQSRVPRLDIRRVSYRCNMTQWREVLEDERVLTLELPTDIGERAWDVVLVDGPHGYAEDALQAGRMSSIYMASRLVAVGGYVFVHDAQREVEQVYCERYLGNSRLAGEVQGRALLRRYKF